MNRECFVQSFDGTELYVSVSGAGTPLVLCDGLGCDGFIWRHLKPAFEDRYSIVRFHYRGHGLSKPPVDTDAIDVAALRKDLLAVLDALELPQAVLLGHSMGCQVILDFALEHADRALGVVPMCGSYGRALDNFHDNPMLSKFFPYLRDVMLRFPDTSQRIWRRLLGSEVAYQLAMNFEVNGKLLQRPDFAPYFQHLAVMDASLFVRLAESLNTHTLEDRLPDVTVPTLVIAGEHDSFTPSWLSHRMQQLIPDAELCVVPSGTHVAPLEIPELVHLRLDRFLRERVGEAGAAVAVEKKPRRAVGSAERRRKKG